MIRINFTPEEKLLAEKTTWHNKELENHEQWGYNRDGNLGEIAFCKFVGQEWKPNDRPDAGVDVYWAAQGATVQVKTVGDEPHKQRMWLEANTTKKNNQRFDYYALFILAQDRSYADFYGFFDRHLAELNSVEDASNLRYLRYK